MNEDFLYKKLNLPCSYFILHDYADKVVASELINILPSKIESVEENGIYSLELEVQWRQFVNYYLKAAKKLVTIGVELDLSDLSFSRYDFPDSSILPNKDSLLLDIYLQEQLLPYCSKMDIHPVYCSEFYYEEEVNIKYAPDFEDPTKVNYKNAAQYLVATANSYSLTERIVHNLIFQSTKELNEEEKKLILSKLEKTAYYEQTPRSELVKLDFIKYLPPITVLIGILEAWDNANTLRELYSIQYHQPLVSIQDFIWRHREDHTAINNLLTIILSNKINTTESSVLLRWIENTSFIDLQMKECSPLHLLYITETLQLIRDVDDNNICPDYLDGNIGILKEMCFLNLQTVRSNLLNKNQYELVIKSIDDLKDNYFTNRTFEDKPDILNFDLNNNTQADPIINRVQVQHCKKLFNEVKEYLKIINESPKNIFISGFDPKADLSQLIKIAEEIEKIGLPYTGFKTSFLVKNAKLDSADYFINSYLNYTGHMDAPCIALKREIDSELRIDILCYNVYSNRDTFIPISCILNEINGYKALCLLSKNYEIEYLELPEKKSRTIYDNLNQFLSQPENQITQKGPQKKH